MQDNYTPYDKITESIEAAKKIATQMEELLAQNAIRIAKLLTDKHTTWR